MGCDNKHGMSGWHGGGHPSPGQHYGMGAMCVALPMMMLGWMMAMMVGFMMGMLMAKKKMMMMGGWRRGMGMSHHHHGENAPPCCEWHGQGGEQGQ